MATRKPRKPKITPAAPTPAQPTTRFETPFSAGGINPRAVQPQPHTPNVAHVNVRFDRVLPPFDEANTWMDVAPRSNMMAWQASRVVQFLRSMAGSYSRLTEIYADSRPKGFSMEQRLNIGFAAPSQMAAWYVEDSDGGSDPLGYIVDSMTGGVNEPGDLTADGGNVVENFLRRYWTRITGQSIDHGRLQLRDVGITPERMVAAMRDVFGGQV